MRSTCEGPFLKESFLEDRYTPCLHSYLDYCKVEVGLVHVRVHVENILRMYIETREPKVQHP